MYANFTDRARKVMQLACEEAQRFNHEYLGTEHILLGLVKEGTGTAAKVLRNLDIDLRRVRLEVERVIQPGPETVPMSKLPQTPRAKKAIEFAIQEAKELHHNFVGTEHLLLGLIREGEGVAAVVLIYQGLTRQMIREEILRPRGQDVAKSTPPVTNPAGLPTAVDNAVAQIDKALESLQRMKENAVARADFEWAAALRDQEDAIQKVRQFLTREGRRESD